MTERGLEFFVKTKEFGSGSSVRHTKNLNEVCSFVSQNRTEMLVVDTVVICSIIKILFTTLKQVYCFVLYACSS